MAIRTALAHLGRLPAGAYLALNLSPDALMSDGLLQLLVGVPGDRIVVHLNNTPEFVYLYYACAKTGVLPVMALLPQRPCDLPI